MATHVCLLAQEQMYERVKILLVTGITENVSIIDKVTSFSSFGLLGEKKSDVENDWLIDLF